MEADENSSDSFTFLKVCDFGMTKLMEKPGQLQTDYVSTRWYRAPELLVNSNYYDKSIDVWALGCILPELLTGQPLFPGENEFRTLAFIIKTLGNCLTEEQLTNF